MLHDGSYLYEPSGGGGHRRRHDDLSPSDGLSGSAGRRGRSGMGSRHRDEHGPYGYSRETMVSSGHRGGGREDDRGGMRDRHDRYRTVRGTHTRVRYCHDAPAGERHMAILDNLQLALSAEGEQKLERYDSDNYAESTRVTRRLKWLVLKLYDCWRMEDPIAVANADYTPATTYVSEIDTLLRNYGRAVRDADFQYYTDILTVVETEIRRFKSQYRTSRQSLSSAARSPPPPHPPRRTTPTHDPAFRSRNPTHTRVREPPDDEHPRSLHRNRTPMDENQFADWNDNESTRSRTHMVHDYHFPDHHQQHDTHDRQPRLERGGDRDRRRERLSESRGAPLGSRRISGGHRMEELADRRPEDEVNRHRRVAHRHLGHGDEDEDDDGAGTVISSRFDDRRSEVSHRLGGGRPSGWVRQMGSVAEREEGAGEEGIGYGGHGHGGGGVFVGGGYGGGGAVEMSPPSIVQEPSAEPSVLLSRRAPGSPVPSAHTEEAINGGWPTSLDGPPVRVGLDMLDDTPNEFPLYQDEQRHTNTNTHTEHTQHNTEAAEYESRCAASDYVPPSGPAPAAAAAAGGQSAHDDGSTRGRTRQWSIRETDLWPHQDPQAQVATINEDINGMQRGEKAAEPLTGTPACAGKQPDPRVHSCFGTACCRPDNDLTPCCELRVDSRAAAESSDPHTWLYRFDGCPAMPPDIKKKVLCLGQTRIVIGPTAPVNGPPLVRHATAVLQSHAHDIVALDPPVPLGEAWTIAVFIKPPLGDPPAESRRTTPPWRTLVRGCDPLPNGANINGDHQILFKRRPGSFTLGCYLNNKQAAEQHARQCSARSHCRACQKLLDGSENAYGPPKKGRQPPLEFFFKMSGNADMFNDFQGWHALVVVGEGGRQRYYVDGQLVGSTCVQSKTYAFTIGNYIKGGQALCAPIASFRIWHRALSVPDIRRVSNFHWTYTPPTPQEPEPSPTYTPQQTDMPI
ncbi:unnamed protein product [Vitrella brassicaformis CCMP3155]|uniref:Uncharacterized protein n=3 Tax=Vitrella brassicaformis TaxID=1169539 RepID=A0A0G4E8N0_VITBC|nr:unnamed protein product [Vitrella brassicaformis CCMP3155]|eukprot:CEL91717.1 unnamed protein product [Vitrella brassicaformis CCMP3155]